MWIEICGTLLLTHKTITAVSVTLIVNAQLEIQDDSSSATVCSEHCRSATESDTVKADVSSAKRFTSPLVKAVISFMYSENRRGLKIAPCNLSNAESRETWKGWRTFALMNWLSCGDTVFFFFLLLTRRRRGLLPASINPIPTRGGGGHIVPPPPGTLPQISQERLELRTWNFLTI